MADIQTAPPFPCLLQVSASLFVSSFSNSQRNPVTQTSKNGSTAGHPLTEPERVPEQEGTRLERERESTAGSRDSSGSGGLQQMRRNQHTGRFRGAPHHRCWCCSSLSLESPPPQQRVASTPLSRHPSCVGFYSSPFWRSMPMWTGHQQPREPVAQGPGRAASSEAEIEAAAAP